MQLRIIGNYYIDRVELAQVYNLSEKQVNRLCDKIDYYELTDSDLNRINKLVGLTYFIEADCFILTDESQLNCCTNFYNNEYDRNLTNRLSEGHKVIDLENNTRLVVPC